MFPDHQEDPEDHPDQLEHRVFQAYQEPRGFREHKEYQVFRVSQASREHKD
jgi:hypothetical protein